METPKTADVIICGAGMAGISTAYFLSNKEGVQNVLLIDKRYPLTLTSDKSAECYRNWWPDSTMIQFMNRSIDLMEELSRASDNIFNLNRRGYCYITLDGRRISRFKNIAQKRARLGLGPVRLHIANSNVSPYIPSTSEEFEKAPKGIDLILDQDVIQKNYSYLSNHVKAIIHARRCGFLRNCKKITCDSYAIQTQPEAGLMV